jgi:hypothetical protein
MPIAGLNQNYSISPVYWPNRSGLKPYSLKAAESPAGCQLSLMEGSMAVKKIVCLAIFVLFVPLIMWLSCQYAFAYEGACPALGSPAGTTVTVGTAEQIYDAVNTVSPGTTILVMDGTYNLGSSGLYLWIDTPGLTLRSASGDREAVILDDDYSGSEIITVAASTVTIADLTIKRAGTHPIHVVSTDDGDTLNTLIYDVHIIDPGQQAIKINPNAAKTHFTDNGTVACSTIELTDAGRAKVLAINASCYTGGVDGHWSRGWVIRDNVIKGFWCETGLSEHGVHFWTGSRDTVVERNEFVDNARAVGFGLGEDDTGRTYADNPCSQAEGSVGHYGGMIRNNFVFANRPELYASQYGVDGGIAFAQACGARALHNTLAFTSAPFAAIEWRFANSKVDVINNLTTHYLMDRGGSANLSGNLTLQSLSMFADGPRGDLHLDADADEAIDQAMEVAAGLCDDDIDGQTRPIGTAADIGADEYREGSAGIMPLAGDQDPGSSTSGSGSGGCFISSAGQNPSLPE